MKSRSVTIQMKATEQYFPMELSIMLYKVVVTFESLDKVSKCDHSNESHKEVFCRGAVFFCFCFCFFLHLVSSRNWQKLVKT